MNNLDWSEEVAKWNKAAGVTKNPTPLETLLALALIKEEVEELYCAQADKNSIEIADALADIIVTVLGMAYRFDIDLQPVMQTVMESNWSKFAQGVHRRDDGKILKGPAYVPPDIQGALKKGRVF